MGAKDADRRTEQAFIARTLTTQKRNESLLTQGPTVRQALWVSVRRCDAVDTRYAGALCEKNGFEYLGRRTSSACLDIRRPKFFVTAWKARKKPDIGHVDSEGPRTVDHIYVIQLHCHPHFIQFTAGTILIHASDC